MAVFLAYSRTSVVMASGRELCIVLLLGESHDMKLFLHYSRDSSLLLGSIHPPGETISRQLRCTQVMLHPVISLTSDIISTARL